MQANDDTVRNRLLSRLPQPADLVDYRREVAELSAKTQRSFQREKIAVRVLWGFCVVSAIAFLWFDGGSADVPKGPWLALFIFLIGAIELLRHFINSCRIDLLKELKQVQVQVLEVHAALAKHGERQDASTAC
ncbi:MAG: hypothetical protein ABJC74_02225 [Gemmatimonadota bacterium]